MKYFFLLTITFIVFGCSSSSPEPEAAPAPTPANNVAPGASRNLANSVLSDSTADRRRSYEQAPIAESFDFYDYINSPAYSCCLSGYQPNQ